MYVDIGRLYVGFVFETGIRDEEYVMQLSFPAMRGQMGKRDYFVTMVKLSLVPKMFRFKD